MSKLMQRGVLTGVAAVLAGAWASAGVTVLSKPQLGTFTTIQAAVDAASDNDVLLVTAGTYAGFTIDNKSINVLATGVVTVNGPTRVLNLGVNRSVALLDLRLMPVDGFITNINALELTADNGNVRVQGCTLKSSRYMPGGAWVAGHAARVNASTKVVFTQCTLTGRDVGFNSGEPLSAGGDALNMTDSSVALYDCTLKGGRGSDETQPGGGQGGGAVRATNFGLYASGTKMQGGTGGGGDYLGCTFAGDGGDALSLNGAQAQLLDDTLIAGVGNGFYTCTPGVDGQPINSNGGVVNTLSGTRRKMTAADNWTDNSSLPIVVTGQPGDMAWLLFGKKPAFLFVPGLNGVLGIPNPWYVNKRPLGVIGPSGVLNVNLPIGDLQGAVEGWLWTVQGWVQGAHEQFLTGPLRILIHNT